jgi:hypothetical protein
MSNNLICQLLICSLIPILKFRRVCETSESFLSQMAHQQGFASIIVQRMLWVLVPRHTVQVCVERSEPVADVSLSITDSLHVGLHVRHGNL